MLAPNSMHKCFQMALRVENKARRRNASYQRGKGNNNRGFRGRGNFGRGQGPNMLDEGQLVESNGGNKYRGSFQRGGYRGRGPPRGRF